VNFPSPGAFPTSWRVLSIGGGTPIVSYEANVSPGVGVPLAWLPNNSILFSARSGDATGLWQAKLSPKNWKAIEPFTKLTFGSADNVAASANDRTVVFSSNTGTTRLWSFALRSQDHRSGGELLAFSSSGSMDYFPSLSESGKLAYVSLKSNRWNFLVRDLLSGREAWLGSSERSSPYRVSTAITSDGSRVAYSVGGGANSSIFTVGADGGVSQRVCDHCGQVRAWSLDGKSMASQEAVVEGGTVSGLRINRIDPVSGSKTVIAEKRGVNLYAPDFSRDGRWIAFQGQPNGTAAKVVEQLFVAPLDAGLPVDPSSWITVTGLDYFDAGPHWSRDGEMLYFTSNRDGSICLWAVRLDPATKKPAGQPYPVRHFHASSREDPNKAFKAYPVFSLSPDRIVISLEQVQSDLWMMQLPGR
jgi:hypothetical protein